MALRGETGWHALHASHFGETRWAEIHYALHRDVEHVCFLNPFLSTEAKAKVCEEYQLRPTPLPGAYTFEVPEVPKLQYRACIEDRDEGNIFVEAEAESGVVEQRATNPASSPFLLMDGAAIVAALALGAEPEEQVLDLCAAPGGKAMVLAASMFADRCSPEQVSDLRGRLIINDVSKPRASRLQRAAGNFLPATLLDTGFPQGPRVIVTSADACTPHNTIERHGPYDKIIVDAPCTEDRLHFRAAASGKLEEWTGARPRVASDKQLKILSNALWWLKDGGMLIYCCSALARDECDGVIERLIAKTRGMFEVEILPLEERICKCVPGLAAEATDWGTRILPDKSPFGPIYFSRLRLVRAVHVASQRLGA
eukprot:TRINITY_DN22184_c0_g1_i1.p1 TRINITY_DN22184_c0_g1~~TRINITY_DN22184_c0_g1_i1.p1  ORF type:complete len:369 (+),score=65.27 TRINITY_DN22184_c0_g1_i1:58-1164(+)